jgi:hypothetical protein
MNLNHSVAAVDAGDIRRHDSHRGIENLQRFLAFSHYAGRAQIEKNCLLDAPTN